MTNNYAFHPLISKTYSEVHQWLATRNEVKNYKACSYGDATKMLEKLSFLSAAVQFNVFFPPHFFKMAKILKEAVGYETIANWVRNNPRICLIDVGCGAGTATAAFVEVLLFIADEYSLLNEIEIYSLGVDKNKFAIAIYNQMMIHLQHHLIHSKIKLTYDMIPKGIPEAILPTIRKLEDKLAYAWKQPRIAQALITQINLVSPLSHMHRQNIEDLRILQDLGVNLQDTTSNDTEFGRAEALAYEQLFDQAKIDNLHLITIGTTGTDATGYLLGNRVQEMTDAIRNVFGAENKGHTIGSLISGEEVVNYINPPSSYWYEKGISRYTSNFYFSIGNIVGRDIKLDRDWEEIINLTNLRLGWARARNNLFNEAFYDEIEIRLFEQELDANLQRIREQLINYKNAIVPNYEIISYHTPKNETSGRPRGLTRLEEEILSVAIIQQLGVRISNENSYAYRIKGDHNRKPTEYLYEYWWTAYERFIADARGAAANFVESGCVLQVDIKRFYERIIQRQILDNVSDGLYTNSERITWLLEQLLTKELNYHDAGRGITQSSIGSGFFANLYLSPIDRTFGGGNGWNLRFFRYVDDMIFIIPELEHYEEVIGTLRSILEELGLELNEDKIRFFEHVNDFLEASCPDLALDALAKNHHSLTERLWMLDQTLRSAFAGAYRRGGDDWWEIIETYRICLSTLGIYVSTVTLSRKIFKYLFNARMRNKNLAGQSELDFPILPDSNDGEALNRWVKEFKELNSSWLTQVHHLKTELTELFDTVHHLDRDDIDKEQQRRLRFAINRLGLLGLEHLNEAIENLLVSSPWLFGDLSSLFGDMVGNGLHQSLLNLFDHYQSNEAVASHYIRALILRTLRHAPQFDDTLLDLMIGIANNSGVSTAERLMATETLLYRRYLTRQQIDQQKLDTFRETLNTGEIISHRLLKNFILLLEEVLPEVTIRHDDSLLSDTSEFIVKSAERDLFDYYEPDILRTDYYSGNRPSNNENNQGSP